MPPTVVQMNEPLLPRSLLLDSYAGESTRQGDLHQPEGLGAVDPEVDRRDGVRPIRAGGGDGLIVSRTPRAGRDDERSPELLAECLHFVLKVLRGQLAAAISTGPLLVQEVSGRQFTDPSSG